MKGLNYRTIVDTMQDGVFLSCRGIVEYVNDALLRMIGYEKNEVIGKKFIDFIHKDDKAFLNDRYQKRMRGENVPNEYEFRLQHRNGNIIYVIGSMSLIDLDKEKGITGTLKDITDRIKSELKIKEMEISYRTLLELCPDPIVVSDFSGNIIMHNQAAYDAHEPKSSNFELIGKNVADFMANDEEKKFISERAGTQSNMSRYTIHFKTQKGRIIPFELHTATVYDAQGVPTCKLSIGRDISQIKEYEKQLKQLISDKELIINEIHHRIKNNLQQVYSLLGLQMEGEFVLRNYPESIMCENSYGCFSIIRNTISDARRRILAISLVHEMFYKLGADCIEFSLFIKELVNKIKETYEIGEKDIAVNVLGDSFELCLDYIIPCGLIINEIIVNSYKYAFKDKKSGIINIELSRSNGTRTMKISDNGVGMSVEDIAKSKTLGLSLIGGLTEQIGGTVHIDSDHDKGTTYTIEFADRKTKGKNLYR